MNNTWSLNTTKCFFKADHVKKKNIVYQKYGLHMYIFLP